MAASTESDVLLVQRVRAGQSDAWSRLIDQFEGRLLAFIESRTKNRAVAEDLVQETFVGFLTSLPNYDQRRPLEGYLFSIAAHKLTDHLRREGRRPTLPLIPESGSKASSWEPAGRARPASSILRSGERRQLEERALTEAIAAQVDHWQRRGDWQKLQCAELPLRPRLAEQGSGRVAGRLRADGGQSEVRVHRQAPHRRPRPRTARGGLPGAL